MFDLNLLQCSLSCIVYAHYATYYSNLHGGYIIDFMSLKPEIIKTGQNMPKTHIKGNTFHYHAVTKAMHPVKILLCIGLTVVLAGGKPLFCVFHLFP